MFQSTFYTKKPPKYCLTIWTQKIILFHVRCPVPCFDLQWGRSDAESCSTTEPALPSPTMTGDEMFDYYQTGFGFSKAQVSFRLKSISPLDIQIQSRVGVMRRETCNWDVVGLNLCNIYYMGCKQLHCKK